jgi:hypothetical protein
VFFYIGVWAKVWRMAIRQMSRFWQLRQFRINSRKDSGLAGQLIDFVDVFGPGLWVLNLGTRFHDNEGYEGENLSRFLSVPEHRFDAPTFHPR